MDPANQPLEGVRFAILCAQPWATITVEGPCAFHNLGTRPASTILGQRVAILAAGKPDLETGGQAMELLAAAGITAAVRTGWTTRKVRGQAIGTALVVGIVTESEDPWFVGPFALVLEHRQALQTPQALPSGKPMGGGIWRLAE